ncbi:GNAT family N-acetyltransferase [Streptomyces sp. BV286]|uniref:GNAT family N-acetyltransferase n=1 Tax=unclassified Streptomyces TaxID=2593676 RepID=UPI001C2EF558|nr:GNAT family N-acetyltransferase [Streptomyces sp. BV286]MBV1936167.1 GNAT family N-acetyltransferase [Streptomyces sp. BV286]
MKSENTGAPARTSVRPRTDEDLDACVRVLAAVHESDGYPVNWPDEPGGWLSQSSLLTAWVAERDSRVVGHVALSRDEPGDLAPGLWRARRDANAVTAVVSRLFVAPEARGNGIGALLLTRASQEAGRRGLHPVLDVVATDRAAAALYERQGWQRLATAEQRWAPDRTVTVHAYAAGTSTAF